MSFLLSSVGESVAGWASLPHRDLGPTLTSQRCTWQGVPESQSSGLYPHPCLGHHSLTSHTCLPAHTQAARLAPLTHVPVCTTAEVAWLWVA